MDGSARVTFLFYVSCRRGSPRLQAATLFFLRLHVMRLLPSLFGRRSGASRSLARFTACHGIADPRLSSAPLAMSEIPFLQLLTFIAATK